MRYICLYNPKAGNAVSNEKLNRLNDFFSDGEILKYDLTKITYDEFLSSVNKEDKIVLCGGDGTLNKFVNAIKNATIENDVYLYATGTGNDFLTDVGGSKDEPVLINDYIFDLPIVEVNGKTYSFVNGIGYGIDGYCCETGDKLKEKGASDVNYTAIAIKGLLFGFKPRNAEIIVDGEVKTYKKVWLAPVMNGRYYGGGMIPTPNQSRTSDKGNVSLMLFHGSGKLKTLMIFPSIFKGEHVKHTKQVKVFEGDVITVKFDKPTALQIDGETILNVTEYTVYSRNELKKARGATKSA